ncbi:MAG: hypothetical protein U0V75_00865 [Ferruginibacter sp.]
MKKLAAAFLLAAGCTLFYASCKKSSDTTTTGGSGGSSPRTFTCVGISPAFTADVKPILNTVCSINSNCHAAGSTNSGGPFTTYAEVNAKKSNIRAAILSGVMPQTGSISQAQINAFICWIDSGAPNN